MTNNNIKLDNVSIDYNGKIILQNINFNFNNKGIYTLMGPNGSGKTTLLKAISGQKKIQKGHIRNIEDINISYVPDTTSLYEYLTGFEYLIFVGKLNNINKQIINQKSTELLKKLDLWNDKDIIINNYSNGMKQKLALASAMLIEPDILILDEPMTGTDYTSNYVIKSFLHSYGKNKLILLSTHFIDMSYELSDFILTIKNQSFSEIINVSKTSYEEFVKTIERSLYNEK
ncbi:ABC transporter ATP-binding protein [Staphylococcus borealis]|uniref:ABC transporter ATP-binding protein n=1 Tax=Staphylococcus borealis TaxID=2742203 RepID=UPI002DBB0A16|nr:ABC transporter ATP-binding protein [Staphylococcus borealis]MEB7367629.1 ABC transporter ATP-binding protein [Staphylococcus borealis]